MKTILVIFCLRVQSSFLENSESDATEQAFDTIQFLAIGNNAWRIKTYAQDKDVHVWTVNVTAGNIVDLAFSNSEKHYGDVLGQSYILETNDGLAGIRRELVAQGLSDHLAVSEEGFFFWTFDGANYRTKSNPDQ